MKVIIWEVAPNYILPPACLCFGLGTPPPSPPSMCQTVDLLVSREGAHWYNLSQGILLSCSYSTIFSEQKLLMMPSHSLGLRGFHLSFASI